MNLDPTSRRRPTIRDVASAAGVSRKTVSRVLNNEGTVARETARRVEQAIRDLDFHPDQTARNLRLGQRMEWLGLVVSDLSNPHVTALAHGVEEVMREGGHTLVLANADDDHEQEQALIRGLLRREVAGLVIVPSGSEHDHLAEASARIPLVIAHREVPGLEVDVVLPDDAGATRRGVAAVLAAGHQRVAFLGDWEYIHNIQERLRGYRQAHEDAGVAIDEELVIFGSHSSGSAQANVEELLSRDDPPTAIFAANDLNCLGTLQALAAMPTSAAARSGADQVVVLGFDELPLAQHFGVPVTLLTYDQRELGRIAGQLLRDRLRGDTGPPQRVVVPVRERSFHQPRSVA